MRVGFRTSYFGQVAKANLVSLSKSKHVSSCVKSDAEKVLGPCVSLLVGFSSSATRFLDIRIRANVDYYHVWRRAECASVGPGLKHPIPRCLTLSLAAKRRAEALHWVLFSSKQPRPPRWPTTCCCVSRMRRSHKRISLGALLFLVDRSAPASTDN